MQNEAANKTEYSILQSFESQYSSLKNDKPYIVVKNALGTQATVIAFPIKGKGKGYVVMLAQADGNPKTKMIPEADFVVTSKALTEVKTATKLSAEIEKVIVAHL
ncbi:MAG: hypothetical protein Q7S71_04910 [Candidatus Nitrotoga sp.]|nr:hypothetical protein [Candidatus Nitrotoga sp.]